MSQRRVVSLALIVAAAAPLTACGLDAPDETSREKSQVQAANFAVGGIQVRNAYVTYPATSPGKAFIVATFVNRGASSDTLTGATTPLGAVTVRRGPLSLPPGVVVSTTDPTLAPTGTTMSVAAGTATPAPVGTTVPVTFTFGAAGSSPGVPLPVVGPGATTLPTQAVPTDTPTAPVETGEPASD